MNLIIKTHFDAAHYLEDYQGKCATLHGHRWELEVYIDFNPETLINGMAMDFGDLKTVINKMLPDHQHLNEVFPFNPTCENIALQLKGEISTVFPVSKVVLWESPTSGVEV